MFRRALCGAVCAVLLAGCSVDEAAEQQQLQTAPVSLFDPVSLTGRIVPLPFDAFLAGFSDPTLNIPNSTNAPFVTAANLVDGWSTVAPIFTDLVGFVDLTTANNGQGVIVVNASTGAPLVPGTDYVVQGYPALDDADGVPINEKRTRLLIQPLRPLMPSTRYVVALTRALTNEAGENALPSEQFQVVASGTPVEEQDAPILDFLTAGQRATLETLRSQIIRPTVEGLALAGIPEQSLILAWPFTTQSIGKTLAAVQENVTPTTLGVQAVPTSDGMGGTRNLNTGDLGLGLPGNADIYAGFLDVPYYGQTPSMENPTAPLTAFWQASDAMADTDFDASFAGVPCGAFFARSTLPNGITVQPSVSTTTCFPVPVAQSTQRIPVLVTVPNTSAAPAGGWPVVIFQHGITQNRSNLFPIAPALAQAGFLAIAIDHPLHGVAPCEAGTAGCLRVPGVSERTFDVDYVNNATSVPVPDGTPDPSGTHYLNLSSLITGRDNVRQSVADLIQLRASLGALNANPATPVNTASVGFVGHSLGGISGGTLAGVVPQEDIGPFSLANPGGGIAKLLDGSLNFGPVVAAGLAAAGFNEGGDTFETFLRFAQLVIDDGDPINYALDATANHPIHMISVDGDQVVPNNVPAGPTTARNHLVTIPGPLSGTDPLAAAQGLEVIPVDVGTTTALRVDTMDGVRAVTVLSEGDHGSILNPAASLAATTEIQRQIANFQASRGTCLPIGQSCPVPTATQ